MIKNRMERRGQGGFTLIELLVVIAILGILAGVVVFAVTNITKGAKDNACKIEKRSLQTAIEAAAATESSTDTWHDFVDNSSAPAWWSVTGGSVLSGINGNSGDCNIS